MIKKITKPIKMEYTRENINLPSDLKEKIQSFWDKAVMETPTLYNGEDFGVEELIKAI